MSKKNSPLADSYGPLALNYDTRQLSSRVAWGQWRREIRHNRFNLASKHIAMTTAKPRYLTKSRFTLAGDCQTKLFYTAKNSEYFDTSFEDEFLKALAEGGIQVGELAKALHPGGHDIQELDYESSVQKTAELLQREDVTIHEAAFLFENLFIRADVLVKKGNSIDLIEVKAKSCNGPGEAQFLKKKGTVRAEWKPYLEDVAFQHYVLSNAYPEWHVRSHIMLVDKQATCPTSGLHQKFLLTRDESGRAHCEATEPLTSGERNSGVLVAIPLAESLEQIIEVNQYGPSGARSFENWIKHLAESYANNERLWAAPSAKCKDCQFRPKAGTLPADKKSGFGECWQHAFNLEGDDFEQDTILDIWFGKTKVWLEEGHTHIADLNADDFGSPQAGDAAMDRQDRQWLQVRKNQKQDLTHELRSGLKDEMESWVYPLHFIDFETMAPAIPMHARSRPYETLAFQFSHHVVQADGAVEHVGEYIEDELGAFPNFDFVRALKHELDQDEGTIFRYADHENTVLCAIRRQLIRARNTLADAAELIAFIESITKPTGKVEGEWVVGPRNMVDLRVMVMNYYFDPRMKGSNSIKSVLPAVLNTSEYLKEKYRAPIYGAEGGIPSKNFTEQVWVQEESGEVLDPYKLLPTMFEGFSEQDRELLLSQEGSPQSLNNGGAAMTAFAKMQFTKMGDTERQHLRGSLLKYCELDTLAMVMIWQAWKEWFAESSDN